ncbi:phage portal protein, partial [Thioclava sp. BHET1]
MGFQLWRRGAARRAPEVKVSASAQGLALAGGAGRVAWSARDCVSLTRSGFQGNPVGYRA